MRARLALAAGVLVVGVAACNDQPHPTSPSAAPVTATPGAVISDGANGNGNPNFFFLPPLVTNPNQSTNWRAGTFNAHLQPVVRVFLLPPGTTNCGIKAAPVYGPAPLLLDGYSEQYQLNWDTKASNLQAGSMYRLCVYGSPTPPDQGGVMLGFADLQPVVGGMKKLATGDVYAFQDDRTLPIKVRIQNGALTGTGCPDPTQCTESVVTGAAAGSAGDTAKKIVIPSGFAALVLPPGAVKPGETVTVVIAQQPPSYPVGSTEQCLPTDLAQSKGCWRFSSEPAGYAFQHDVKVEFCVDAAPVPENQRDQLRVFKHDSGTVVQELPWVDPTDVACGQFSAMGNVGAAPSSFATAALRRVGRWAGWLLLPRPLYARRHTPPRGIGGSGGSFSDFGGAVAPDVTIDSVSVGLNRLVIGGGDSVPLSRSLTNHGSGTLTNVALKAWIEQPGVSRYALSDSGLVWCGQVAGELPPGTCGSYYQALWVSNAQPGSGTLVPGRAIVRIELSQPGLVLVTDTVPVTLTNIAIKWANLSTGTLVISGDSSAANATLINTGDKTLLGVEFHAWIEQNSASREAHSAVALNAGVAYCSPTLGALPPGSCFDWRGLFASNTSAGTGTLVAGMATIRYQLTQADTELASLTGYVQLTTTEITGVLLSSGTLSIGGPPMIDTVVLLNTGGPLSGVRLKTLVHGVANGASYGRPAGEFDVQCGAGAGILPSGSCRFGSSLTASNSVAGGWGTLVPGPAEAEFLLVQGTQQLGNWVEVPVTLVGPTQIAVYAGNGESAVAGTAVATPPAVIVRDQNGNPVADVDVLFVVQSGGGTVVPSTWVKTTSNGIAALTSWTLGTTAGGNVLAAYCYGLQFPQPLIGSPLQFFATGVPGTPTQIAVSAGNAQTAQFGTTVATPPSVIVRDVNNNPVGGVTVAFSVTGGGGSIDPPGGGVTTGSNGVAALNSWTLGPTAGTNTLIAASLGLTGSPVTFTATGSLLPTDVASSLAFVGYSGGQDHIYRVDPGATSWIDITPDAPPGSVNERPAWWPDGTKLVFSSIRGGDGIHHLYVMNRDGSGVQQLTAVNLNDYWPAVSPDGSQIAFERPIAGGEGSGVFVMGSNGSNQLLLTSGSSPAWSPNGLRLAFSSYRYGLQFPDIWAMTVADTSDKRQLTSSPLTDRSPAWSPAGDLIAYACASGGFEQPDICLVTPAGVSVANLLFDGTVHNEPVWSPDGNWIAFTRSDVDMTYSDIFIVHPDGTGLKRLTDGTMRFSNPAWPLPYHP